MGWCLKETKEAAMHMWSGRQLQLPEVGRENGQSFVRVRRLSGGTEK